MRRLAWLWLLTVLAPQVRAADRVALIDFGHANAHSGGGAIPWNDVDVNLQLAPIALLDTSGAPTGISLSFPQGGGFGRVDTSGVAVAQPGSELEQLGWPASATSDALYSGATPVTSEVAFTLSGLDPTATYDCTFLASVLGATDDLATAYTVAGADTAAVVLEPRDNAASVAHVVGLRPDANAELVVRTRAATTNSEPTRDFYLNALRVTEHPAGGQPPLLGFARSSLEVWRLAGQGAVSATLSSYTNDGADPLVTLTASDGATGATPTWLAHPRAVFARQAIAVDVDPGALPPGAYAATLTARASGYLDATAVVRLVVHAPGGAPNVLYYGNSYLSSPAGSIPELVERAAEELGAPPPRTVLRLAPAKNLTFHAADPDQVDAISLSLPLGAEWDLVVMQGGSLEPTVNSGNPAQFLAAAETIVANVEAHSPGARACFFQTWARATGHPVYSGANPTFGSPLEMHEQLEASYVQAEADANAAWGPGSAVRAAAGETAALWAFDPWIYGADLKHPGPALATMGAMNLFSILYDVRAGDLRVDFATPGPLGAELATMGIDATVWRQLAGIADRAGAPALRRHPGSSADLLLTSGAAAPLDACSLVRLAPGSLLHVRVTSPNGTYDGVPVTLHADLFPNGRPPGPYPPMPELHYDPASAWLLAATPALEAGGLSASVPVQPWMVGRTLLLQAVAQAPSAETGHPITATDAHELRTTGVPLITAQ